MQSSTPYSNPKRHLPLRTQFTVIQAGTPISVLTQWSYYILQILSTASFVFS